MHEVYPVTEAESPAQLTHPPAPAVPEKRTQLAVQVAPAYNVFPAPEAAPVQVNN